MGEKQFHTTIRNSAYESSGILIHNALNHLYLHICKRYREIHSGAQRTQLFVPPYLEVHFKKLFSRNGQDCFDHFPRAFDECFFVGYRPQPKQAQSVLAGIIRATQREVYRFIHLFRELRLLAKYNKRPHNRRRLTNKFSQI